MDPIETLVNIIVQGYGMIVAFLIGWTIPRGNALRGVQLWFLRKVHNFLAREDERIQESIERKRQQIKKARKE